MALSITPRQIMPSAEHTTRAGAARGGLLILLMLVPQQERRVLGAELLAPSGSLAGLSIRVQVRTLRRLQRGRRAGWVIRLLPFNAGTLAVVVAGASLEPGRLGGIYWLVPTVLVYLLRAVLNAWTLLVWAAGP